MSGSPAFPCAILSTLFRVPGASGRRLSIRLVRRQGFQEVKVVQLT